MKSPLFRFIFRFLPNKLLRHYLYPCFFINKKEYNPAEYFDSWYESVKNVPVSDAMTISLDPDNTVASCHYRAVEDTISDYFKEHPQEENWIILDIGSGTGHWIDFYLSELNPARIYALELSEKAAEFLINKYKKEERVEVLTGDISQYCFPPELKFHFVSAIGVMFHIVDDHKWESSLVKIYNILRENGRLLASDQFGYITRDVQFHTTDKFKNREEVSSFVSLKDIFSFRKSPALINKRIRSLKKWKKAAARAGLKFEIMLATKDNKALFTPENNLAVWIKQ